MRVLTRQFFYSFCLFALVVIAGCGGGGGGGSTPPPAPAPAPSGLTYTSPQSLRLNTPITAVDPIVAGTVTSYSIAPALPAGLTLNPTTGRLSGTPTATAASASYTITASNGTGSTTFKLSLKVYDATLDASTVTRFAVQGTSIYPTVVVRPVNLDVPALYVRAADSSGLILPAVDVTTNTDGTFTLQLTTDPSAAARQYTGDVTLTLWRDSNFITPLEVTSLTLHSSIAVMSASTAWPGDHQTALAAWNGVPEWSTVQGNASHTGFVPVTLNPDAVTTRWKQPGNPIANPWTPVKPNLVTSDGLFYVVSSPNIMNGGTLYARRETDGSEVWHNAFSGFTYPAASPAGTHDGVVYIVVGHQSSTYMLALNAHDGTEIYRAPMTSQWEQYFAPTVGPNGMVYTNGGTYGGLYGFGPTGNTLYFASLSQQSNWSPAVDSKGVYAYVGDRLVVADPLTGVFAHEIVNPTFQNYIYEIGGAPVLGAAGSVFAASYSNSGLTGIGNTLINFRTDTDSIGWKIAGSYPTTPAYDAGVLYAVNNTPLQLEARAESDGALLWSWSPASTQDTRFNGEVLMTRNLLFVSTNAATYAIDLKTHRPVFSYPAWGSLALSPNGILYIHNPTDLIALNLK